MRTDHHQSDDPTRPSLALLAAHHASRRDGSLQEAARARDAATEASSRGEHRRAALHENIAALHVEAANIAEWLRQQSQL